MAEPRKIFRIEETAASRPAQRATEAQAPPPQAALLAEIAKLRALLAEPAPPPAAKMAKPQRAETERLASELNLIADAIGSEMAHTGGRSAMPAPMTRVVHELEEVVNGTELATQKILAAAEEIDQVARSLFAALTGKYEQGLAQDVQDFVIRIFEACNFQDLASQRVTKVLGVLNFVEDHVSRVLDEINNPAAAEHGAAQYLHGPRLESDTGHVTQDEIDAMFGA